MNELTIFTPTYNRAHLLPFLYKSLCQQQIKNFIWLIIDDGSEDNTKSIVNKWIQDGIIQIKYVYQKNSGKHLAHNKAVELCDTDLFTCVDSDDILTKDAVEIILDYWHNDKNNGLNQSFVGYCARRGDLEGRATGKNWLSDNRLVSFFDLNEEYRFRGELVLIWISSVLKQYTFPYFKGEYFVTENVLYYQISYKQPMKLINDIFYLFEYKPDGYTKQGDLLYYKNPYGYAVYRIQAALLSRSLGKKIRWLARYKGWIEAFSLDMECLNKAVGKLKLPQINMVIDILSNIYSKHYKEVYLKKKRGYNL